MKTSKPTSRHGKEIVPESLPETAVVTCPYCGETEELFVDAGGGEHQTYTEDCSVCCHPRVVHVEPAIHGRANVWIEREA
ncbi:MAG: CPXCG motif-containing cysteine-rich protein [Polyangiaceae bacterium]